MGRRRKRKGPVDGATVVVVGLRRVCLVSWTLRRGVFGRPAATGSVMVLAENNFLFYVVLYLFQILWRNFIHF